MQRGLKPPGPLGCQRSPRELDLPEPHVRPRGLKRLECSRYRGREPLRKLLQVARELGPGRAGREVPATLQGCTVAGVRWYLWGRGKGSREAETAAPRWGLAGSRGRVPRDPGPCSMALHPGGGEPPSTEGTARVTRRSDAALFRVKTQKLTRGERGRGLLNPPRRLCTVPPKPLRLEAVREAAAWARPPSTPWLAAHSHVTRQLGHQARPPWASAREQGPGSDPRGWGGGGGLCAWQPCAHTRLPVTHTHVPAGAWRTARQPRGAGNSQLLS